jgi:DNA-binding response OmpR family regulator
MEYNSDILHIFVIDDDEFLLAAIKRSLENAGHKVTTSNNVHDAYFKLNFLTPDVVMLDIIMPDINGIEFMSLLNSPTNSSATPVILMSYLPEKEIRQLSYELEKVPYLAKPFNFSTLPKKIEKLFLKNKAVTSTSSF